MCTLLFASTRLDPALPILIRGGVVLEPRRQLANVDIAWLHLDRTENTADIVSLLAFARPLEFTRVRELIETRLLSHRSFRDRIVSEGLLGHARWEPDPAFALSDHLLRHRLTDPSRSALEEFINTVVTEPLDFRHSPWRTYLVDRSRKGSVLITKLHHCLGDGFALVSLLLSLADDIESAPERARRSRPTSARRLVIQSGAIARSLARMALLPPDHPTVLKRPLTGRRRAAWSEGLSLQPLHARCRLVGATVNDVLLAMLAGALRDYLGNPTKNIRALVPVNLRRPGEVVELNNRFGLVFVDLPIASPTPAERLESIVASMKSLKAGVDPLATFATLGAMGFVPTPVERLIADFFVQKVSLVVTNVPGPRQRIHMAGGELDHMVFWVPHPVCLGLGISILSYAGSVRLGVRADEAVMPNPSELVRLFEREVAAFTGPPPPRRVPRESVHQDAIV